MTYGKWLMAILKSVWLIAHRKKVAVLVICNSL